MENFWLHAAKIVGTPTAKSGSWVHIFSPTEESKLNKRGHLLAVIGLTNFNAEGELTVVGREIIARLHEEYYGDLQADAFDQLKKTVAKINQEVGQGADFELNLGVVVMMGDLLYGMMNRGSRLLAFRQGEVKTIFKNEENGSGYLQNQDVFLLGTEEFFRLVGEEMINSALKASSPDETVEILAPAVHGQPDGSSAAIVFRIFRKEKEATIDDSVVVKPPVPRQGNRSDWGRKFREKISSLIVSLDEKLKRRVIYLKSHQEKAARSQRMLFTVALVLLVILGVSVFFGAKQRGQSGPNPQVEVLLKQARQKKEEGEGLKSLNPAKAEQLLQEAQSLVGKIEKLGGQSQEFLIFKQELELSLLGSSKEYEVQGETFLDLELLKAGAFGDQLLLSGDQLIVLDKQQKAVYGIGLNDKKSSILFGGEKMTGTLFLTQAGEDIYLLTEEGILKGGKNSLLVVKKDEEWGQIAAMLGFSGHLYLLDKGGEIWKYPAGEDGFGPKQKWLKEKLDLSAANNLMADGSLWVLNQNGQVFKLLQGQKDNFVFSGLEKPLVNPVAFFTDIDTQNLYILDKGNARVVVFNKSGEYQLAYHWEQISQATDLLVLEEKKQLFLLIGSKIYQLKLK